MKKLYTTLVFFLLGITVFAQPANDNCTGAISLGTLGNPGACGSGVKNGTTSTVTSSLNSATPENPYVTLTGCTGGTMATPANDVWYSFVAPANGSQVTIVISGAAFTPNIALWQGSCSGLTGRGCSVGTAGNGTLTAAGMVSGQTYYIQLSGNTGQSGAFTMAVHAWQDCADCMTGSSLTVTPLPVNGMYQPGQTVQFCYHVSSYDQVNTNWLHGVQVTYGAGWNAASITATPPAACASGGTWLWLPNGETGTVNGQTWGQGFYYDLDNDGNPTNNFGDDCSGAIAATAWNFCVKLTVSNTCNPGANLGVTFNTSGDGESGSWSNAGCSNDPSTQFFAVQGCCPPTVTSTSVLCNGGSTGSVNATAVTGAAGNQDPYTFAWTGPASTTNTVTTGTTNTFSNVPAGTYTVVVTDKNLCSASNTVTVVQPTTISASATPHNITCAATGSITTTAATGGTSPYTYSWAGPGAYSSATQSPTGLTTAGVYTLTVTDHNNCTFTTTANVTQTGTITVTVNNASVCAGTTATLTASGATTYSWSTGATTASITVSPATTTSYTVIGTTGTCTNSATSTVTIAPSLSITVNSATICSGTSATLTASGGTTYSWTPGTNLSATTGSTVTANPTTTTVYTVTGNTGGCTGTATSTVTIAPSLSITVNNATICSGTSATLTASGGTTYSWTPATDLSATTGSTVTASPTATTVYTVTGNTGGCTGSATSTVTIAPSLSITVNSATICPGTSATLTASGATTYSWTPATDLSATTGASVTANPTTTTVYTINGSTGGCTGSATSTVTVASTLTISVTGGAICKGQTTLSLTANSNASTFAWTPTTGLTPTTGSVVVANPTTTQVYTVVGTAGTCTVSTTATVTVNNPPTLATTSSTICAGQQTGTVTVSGASTYNWSGGGITGNTTANPTDNPANTTVYTVNATDVNTCTATATATITVNPLPTVTVNSTTICLGQQTASLTAAGASTYSWTPGLSSTTGSTVTGTPAATTSYTVTGTDANGCTDTSVATITVINNPTLTVASGAICVGQQTITLTALSNAANFTWSPATGLSATTGNSVQANPSTTQVYTIVGSTGTCTVSTTATVTVNALPVPTASANVPCETENPLDLTSNVTPTGTYTYSWTGPNSFTSASQNPSITNLSNVTQALAGGTYSVLVTDNNGCYNTATVTAVINPKPTITATGATVCVGQTINLTANGGSIYSWSGQGGAYTSALPNPSILNSDGTMSGIYNVVGTDANGCYNGAAVMVQVNALPVITVTSGTICEGQQTTTLTASSTNAGTNYTWAPATGLSATTGSAVVANPSPAGTYSYVVTGTDANTCVGTFTTSVVVNTLPVITANSGTICVGQQTATLTASSTNAGTTYNWLPATGLSSTTNTTVTGTPTVTTNYIITGTDANGCIGTGNASILVNALPTITATSGTICTGQTTNLTASGGVTYSWTPATGLASTTGAAVAASPTVGTTQQTYSYTIIGTDANSCISSGSSEVLVYPLPLISVTSSTICMGQQTATLTASGASTYAWSPYTTLSNSTGTSVYGFPTTIGENDYMVTGTDVHMCVNTATTSIWVNALPTAVINTVTPECVPFCTTLTVTPTPATGSYNYNWTLDNMGQTSQTAHPMACYTVAGNYVVKLLLTDGNGCTTTSSTGVNALSIPIADFDYGPQPVSILTPEVQFTNESTGGLPNHTWNFGDVYSTNSHDTSAVNNPIHTYSQVGTYNVTLTVSTANGCSATVTKPIIINEDYAIYVPNAFSPNGDGKNEFFKAEGEGIKDYKLYVFDRWGLMLFYSDDINKGWDGKYQGGGDLVQEDVYVWKIQVTDFKNKARNLNGTVTLLK